MRLLFVLGGTLAALGSILWALNRTSVVSTENAVVTAEERQLRRSSHGSANPPAESASTDSRVAKLKRALTQLSPGPESTVDLPDRAVACSPFDRDCGECRHDTDCLQGHACLIDPGTREPTCFKSDCENDGDCAVDEKCRFFPLSGPQEQLEGITRCVLAKIPIGSECELGHPLVNSCIRGAVCSFGSCAPTCNEDNDCNKDYECAESSGKRSVCRPKCPDCQEGEFCDPNSTGGRCLSLSGVDCLTHNVCEVGQACIRFPNPSSGAIHMACVTTCDPAAEILGGRKCPDGQVCGFGKPPGICYQACDPTALDDSCPSGTVCGTVTEAHDAFGCIPRAG